MLKLGFVLLCFSFSFAHVYSLENLQKHSNSLAKDYYIYRLLEDKHITQDQALKLKNQIFRYTGKLKVELEKLLPKHAYVLPCYFYTKDNILDANHTCQELRLNSLAFIESLSNDTRQKLLKNTTKQSLIELLNAFSSADALSYIIKHLDTENFLKFYNYQKLDLYLDKEFVDKLATSTNFKTFVKTIVIKQESPKLSKSFLLIDPKNSSQEAAFFLALNALKQDKEELAFEFFKRAYLSFENKALKDNAIFWMWLLKKDQAYLQELSNSTSLNIYSLYAKELLNKDFIKVETIHAKKQSTNYNIEDPFAWQALARQIKTLNTEELHQLAKKFNSEKTLGIYAYILERAYEFKKHYFIMPYFEYLKLYSTHRQALILALARQESRFIPAAISTSYALGMMQFMPFLANHIGKQELKIKNFDQDFMFKPEFAYLFANEHLNYLEKRLNSVIFISYAYNGGIGFTNRMLASNSMFKKGKFEPFLSMELVPYEESRIYAKKVLANYIVYRHLLNDSIKISDIFQNSIQNN